MVSPVVVVVVPVVPVAPVSLLPKPVVQLVSV
jgi:hypothetical protein